MQKILYNLTMIKFGRLQNLLLFAVLVAGWLVPSPTDARDLAQSLRSNEETIRLDASIPTRPFPHFWEHIIGSGRAVLTLRDSWRRDLKKVKNVADIQYVRFHGIFDDDMGVYDEDAKGNPVYNFSYVDQVYDGLLDNNVKPFVELSFMPNKLAASSKLHSFWNKPNVSPPKDWDRWSDLIYKFTDHLVQRYGLDEVSSWYFEVWNEPNIDFWAGEPKADTYYKLYDVTATAIRKVNSRLRVGGPATAQAAWVRDFIEHCAKNDVPIDFVSTHVYANDTSKDVFGTEEDIPRSDMVARAVKMVSEKVKDSDKPKLPIIFSEYNASYMNEVNVTDSPFMGPWLANNIKECRGLVNELAYWCLSDVFDEQGVVKTPFYGGYGLIAEGGVGKAAYNAFKLLHKLGDQEYAMDASNAILTKRADGTVVIAAWNYVPPNIADLTRTEEFKFTNIGDCKHAKLWKVDAQHGSPLLVWQTMGKPAYPSKEQLRQLRGASDVTSPTVLPLTGENKNELSISLDRDQLVVVEICK